MTPESITAAADRAPAFLILEAIMMKHPCQKDCPDRVVGCKISCPRLAEWEAARAEVKKARDRDFMIDDYVTQAVAASRRRHPKKTWKRPR